MFPEAKQKCMPYSDMGLCRGLLSIGGGFLFIHGGLLFIPRESPLSFAMPWTVGVLLKKAQLFVSKEHT